MFEKSQSKSYSSYLTIKTGSKWNVRKDPSVAVLILNYNNVEDTVETVLSVNDLDYQNKSILLVDNGSESKVIEKIERALPNINLLKNGKNLGYAGGNNAGIRRIIEKGSDYIFLLNNDIIVPSDTLTILVETMERFDRCAACQPLVTYFDNPLKVWSAGTQFVLGYPLLYQKDAPVSHMGTFSAPFGLVGCAILFRVSALEDIGLFDESLFLMHEETDWCIRARKKGYSLLVNSEVQVMHKISATLGRFSEQYLYYISRNWLIVSKKHFSALRYFYVITTEIFLRFPYYINHLIRRGRASYIRSYLRGFLDGITFKLS